MSEKPSGERTEDPTPKRKQDARKKGQVARSMEIPGALSLLLVAQLGPMVIQRFIEATRSAIQSIPGRMPEVTTPGGINTYSMQMATPLVMAVLPLLLGIAGVGLASNFAQVGFLFSTESITPKFDKINPANGLKRLFSTRGLGEGLKATLKLAIFTGIAGMEIWNQRDQLTMLAWIGTSQGMGVLGTIAHTILTRIALVWLAIAGLDYFLQRKEMDKNLKMTKDEVRREMKESEGSPEIKSARMQRARQLARGGLKERVKDADVIVTNPTHYAVAIKYERSKMHAPMVVALGTDLVALRIREIAGELKIPIVENRPLARALHKQCDVGDYVPRELFGAVAEVLAYVYQQLNRKAR